MADVAYPTRESGRRSCLLRRRLGRWHRRFVIGRRLCSTVFGFADGVADGYTRGMKTAVSIPDDVFDRAERLAKRGRRSRSEVYSSALREYVARHSPEEVTETMNRVCAQVNNDADSFVAAAGRRVLQRSEW